MKYMILFTSFEGDDYIMTRRFVDLDDAQWYLENKNYTKDSEMEYYKGKGESIKFAQIYESRNDWIKKFEVDGQKYKISELCEMSGLSYKLITTRYERGKRGRELIEPVKPPGRRGRKVEYKGVVYENVNDCSEKTGLTTSQVRYKINANKAKLLNK